MGWRPSTTFREIRAASVAAQGGVLGEKDGVTHMEGDHHDTHSGDSPKVGDEKY